jgi:hypothetical protein
VFLWILAHETLPTADVRCPHKMAETSGCSMWGGEDSWRHSLTDCSLANYFRALVDEGVTSA